MTPSPPSSSRPGPRDAAACSAISPSSTRCRHSSPSSRPAEEARVAGLVYLADCITLAAGGRPEGYDDHPGRDLPTTPGAIAANVAFVSAAGIGSLSSNADGSVETFEQGFGRERARQLAWLTQQLALDPGA